VVIVIGIILKHNFKCIFVEIIGRFMKYIVEKRNDLSILFKNVTFEFVDYVVVFGQ